MSTQSGRARLFASALIGGGALCAVGLLTPAPASATTMKECGANYQAAKKAGTLNGMDWKAYRAANCTATTPAAPATPAANATTPAAPTATAPTASPPSSTVAAPAAPATKTATVPTATGTAVFPAAVSAKYSSLSAGKAREKTCLDQYHANKANGGNGGLNWIQKGGGYYSQCSKKLKGA